VDSGQRTFAVDNLLFPGPGPQLTKQGFGFALADGTYSNPFFADFLPTPEYLEFYSMPSSGSSTELPVTFAATPIPEPATPTLVLAALLFSPAIFRIANGREQILERRQASGPHPKIACAKATLTPKFASAK
jgi:hypothetical protein